VAKAITDSGRADRIIQLGYVPGHHLSILYSLATLYVQPSWYEGFGLPILEAMKFGCPVASSDRGSLSEVGGSAVAYFDPGKNMGEVIRELLASSAKREELGLLGIARAKEFTWEKAARATHAVYERVLSQET
jgi:glycosyltransferase involved in cell wall biosynthesis